MKQIKTVRFAGRLASASLAAIVGATSANAASYNVSPPSETKAINEAGVDMRSGQYNYEQTDLEIGGDGGLTLQRTPAKGLDERFNPFGSFAHNWDIFLTEKVSTATSDDKSAAMVNFGKYPATSSAATVNFGKRTEAFWAYDTETTYRPSAKKAASGALKYTGDRTTASALYTYETNDGHTIEFRAIGSKDCALTSRRCAFASKVTMADGTEYSLGYDIASPGADNAARLRSVTSSRGYALLLEYGGPSNMQVIKACVLNLTLAPKPTTNLCPASAAQTATYAYATFAGETRLASVTEPDGNQYSFAFAAKAGIPVLGGSGTDPNAYEMSYFKPGIATAWMKQVVSRYSRDGSDDYDEVTRSQELSDGRSFSYAYVFHNGLSAIHNPKIAGGTYTSNTGDQVDYSFSKITYPGWLKPVPPGGGALFGDPASDIQQSTPGPTILQDELGRSTRLEYCDKYYQPGSVPGTPGTEIPGPIGDCVVQPLPLRVTNPEGDKIKYTYNSIGLVLEQRSIAKAGSGLPDRVVTMTYGCPGRKCWTKPTSITDPNLNVTTYTYDTTHGGTLIETSPAVDGVTPQKRYEYAQRYAWIKNAANTGYVQSSAPTWMLIRERTCRTTAPSGSSCAGGAADEVVTDYDYGPNSGPNNLLLRGTTVTAANKIGAIESLLSCYAYDTLGRRISETKPAGTTSLTTCP